MIFFWSPIQSLQPIISNANLTAKNSKKNVIKHEFKPIIIKKDTLVFDVKNFAKGNERKMKEILEKRPIIDVVKDYEIISEKELNSRIDRNRNKLSSSK